MPSVVIGTVSAVPIFLAMLLMASAVHKVVQRERLRDAVTALTGARTGAASALLAVAAIAEALAAVGLLVPRLTSIAALAGVAIWGTYLLFLGKAWASGRRAIDCGCSLSGGHSEIGSYHVFRNGALICASGFVALFFHAQGVSIGFANSMFALLLVIGYFMIEELAIVTAKGRQWA